MKRKLLYSALFVSLFTVANAQVLQQENFDALNTATIVGQGTPPYANLNGTSADYMVVTNGTGKALQINGPATADQSRFLWKDGLNTAWAARTAGNNIIKVEFDYFTGGTSTSHNGGGIELLDATYTKYLGALYIHHATKTILGFHTNSLNAGTTVNLGTGTTDITLTPNTWVTLGIAYNTITGETTFYGPGFSKSVMSALDSPHEIDYAQIDLVGTNAAASTHLFDNLTATAVSTLTLGTNDIEIAKSNLGLYPNPATDVLNIKSEGKVKSATIFDASGKKIDARLKDNQVDVRGLQTGNYIITVETENGISSEKFIKK